jgi:hypothetical protein
MKNFFDFVNEMANIEKKGKKLYVGDKHLKDIEQSDVSDNILLWRNNQNTFMFTEGYTMIWFIKDSDLKDDMLAKSDESLVWFPKVTMTFNSSPINDIWKKNKGLQKNIIGCIEAMTDSEQIFISMMSVRPGYGRNGINNIMIKSLIELYPNAEMKFSNPTKDGKEFIKKYYPNAKIESELSESDIKEIIDTVKSDKPLTKWTNNDIRTALNELDVDTTVLNNIRGTRQMAEAQENLLIKHIKENY